MVVAVLLTMIRVSPATRCSRVTHSQDTVVNEQDYVDLGISCADICRALDRGMDGNKLDDLSKWVTVPGTRDMYIRRRRVPLAELCGVRDPTERSGS